MTNNLNIDVSKGKLDQKEKGSLLPIECKTIEETRRYNALNMLKNFVDQNFFDLQSNKNFGTHKICLLYTSPSPRDRTRSRMPSSA